MVLISKCLASWMYRISYPAVIQCSKFLCKGGISMSYHNKNCKLLNEKHITRWTCLVKKLPDSFKKWKAVIETTFDGKKEWSYEVDIVDLLLNPFCRSHEMSKIREIATEKLTNFIMDHMTEYFKFVRKRLEFEVSSSGLMLVFITNVIFNILSWSNHQMCTVKNSFLKILANSIGKHMCLSLLLMKMLLKRDSNTVVFLWNSRNF